MDSKPIYKTKTAAELGIEQWEHEGLVALVGPLSRGALRLDMEKPMCGSVGCIGGHVAAATSRYPTYYVYCGRSAALVNLYFPGSLGARGDAAVSAHPAWKATALQAARAIVNFLVTGDPQWDAVMLEAA